MTHAFMPTQPGRDLVECFKNSQEIAIATKSVANWEALHITHKAGH